MVQLLHVALCDALQRSRRRGGSPHWWLEACINVPWTTFLCTTVAVLAWITWVAHVEAARKHTHAVVEGFGLRLDREPCPLGATLPASLALLVALVGVATAARSRATVQLRVQSGDLPFTSSSATHRYFALSALATTATWAVMAWLGCLLVATGVWVAAMTSVHSAAGAVRPPYGAGLSGSAAAAATAADTAQGGRAADVSGGVEASRDDWDPHWGPDWPGPGGACPPSCVDLSAFRWYLGANVCCCDMVGGIFAAEPNAAAALRSLKPALAALALLVALLSWLVLQGGCQFSHSQSEALTITEATIAAAERAGHPGSLPAVRRLSNWFVRFKDEDEASSGGGFAVGREGAVEAGQASPLLGGGSGGT